MISTERASANGNLKAAKLILQYHEYLVRRRITPNMETPLHVAIMSRNTMFVRYLVNMMSKSDLELVNSDGNTAFCLAAISRNVEMVKAMFLYNLTLLIVCGSYKMTDPILQPATGHKLELSRFIAKEKQLAATMNSEVKTVAGKVLM
ncbi:uncharacterized protein LOC143584872 [Bidens hawaiensis]|uniref:uncharacterized protein LOC143584872 n=1 Tax=Bidens hawaiensis TaxID=980011 RepID=UPI00404A5943